MDYPKRVFKMNINEKLADWKRTKDGQIALLIRATLIVLLFSLGFNVPASGQTRGFENGHEWVDLGLPSGTLWATCNIGSVIEEGYGSYLAWGETQTKSEYSWKSYKWCNGSESSLTKYNNDSSKGTVDNKTVLDPADDAARVLWGSAWRMPTDAEFSELRNSCTWSQSKRNGITGYQVTSKTNGNSIFLPSAGGKYGSELKYIGEYGIYWSATVGMSSSRTDCALNVRTSKTEVGRYIGHRREGLSVRPVISRSSLGQSTSKTTVQSSVQTSTADGKIVETCSFKTETQETITVMAINTKGNDNGFDRITINKGHDETTVSGLESYQIYLLSADGVKQGPLHMDRVVSYSSGYWSDFYDYYDYYYDDYGYYDKDSSHFYISSGIVSYVSELLSRPENHTGIKKGTVHDRYLVVSRKYVISEWDIFFELDGDYTYEVNTYAGVDEPEIQRLLENFNKRTGGFTFLGIQPLRTYIVKGSYADYTVRVYPGTGEGEKRLSVQKAGDKESEVIAIGKIEFKIKADDAVLYGGTSGVITYYGELSSGKDCTIADDLLESALSQIIQEEGIKDKNIGIVTPTISITSTPPTKGSSQSKQSHVEKGHEWVDLGLSVCWATCNIGATKAGDYGNYYAWGEITAKNSFTWENYKFRTGGDSWQNVRFSKYNTNSQHGSIDSKTKLDISDDTAHSIWGGAWRMPTPKEYEELNTKCKWEWSSQDGHQGYRITGPNGNSIFLPAAGYIGYAGLCDPDKDCDYWTSSLDTSDSFRASSFGSSSRSVSGTGRSIGQPIRPVMTKTSSSSTSSAASQSRTAAQPTVQTQPRQASQPQTRQEIRYDVNALQLIYYMWGVKDWGTMLKDISLPSTASFAKGMGWKVKDAGSQVTAHPTGIYYRGASLAHANFWKNMVIYTFKTTSSSTALSLAKQLSADLHAEGFTTDTTRSSSGGQWRDALKGDGTTNGVFHSTVKVTVFASDDAVDLYINW